MIIMAFIIEVIKSIFVSFAIKITNFSFNVNFIIGRIVVVFSFSFILKAKVKSFDFNLIN